MKHTWLVIVVVVAFGGGFASAEPGPATKDSPAPSTTSPAPASGGSGAKAQSDGAETKDGGALQQSSLFGSKSAVPWRGSQIVYRNAFSAVSLNSSADLTHNPYYAMSWSFQPWWWFTKSFYLRASLDVERELTVSDVTTYEGEALLGDLRLVAGFSNVYRIPKVKIDLSFDLVLTAPTSKASLARTMVLGVGPGMRVSRTFKGLKGIILGYNVRVTPTFHRYTTAELASPLVPGCHGTMGGCDSFLNTGRRNAMVRVAHYGDFSVRFLKWLGASLAVGQAVDWLYPLGDASDAVSLALEEPENKRWLTFIELQVAFRPLKMLEIALGYTALHPQRRPDSRYYVPFFNRYSALYLDLKLKIDGLVERIKRSAK